MIKRTLEKRLALDAGKYPVVAVTGPRQSGKTTLVTKVFPRRAYVSLEDPDTRGLAVEDPRGFIEGLEAGSIIDEIQRVPELLSYMQTLVDQRRGPGQFILTGSNQLLLMKHVSQSLAGRISILKLLPFTLSELGKHAPSQATDYIYTGAYPRIYDEKHNPSDWYLHYIETYLEKDLKESVDVLDLDNFRRFLAIAASMCGQLVNLSEIGNMLGISHNTVKAWLAALEQSFLIFRLQPYHRNFRKRLVKTPKLYFYDTGLACALLRLREPGSLRNHHFYGALFENMVMAELQKESLHRVGQSDLFFWRDHRGTEIDCIRDVGGVPYPIEIKASKTIRADFFSNLHRFCEMANLDPSSAALVYGGDRAQQFQGSHAFEWSNASRVLSL
ncbi:MAG: ATP-binding protein [Verrucomicrobia bacterium]|nr:ATP-binding protein [Verrucomicrobiota bacterium]